MQELNPKECHPRWKRLSRRDELLCPTSQTTRSSQRPPEPRSGQPRSGLPRSRRLRSKRLQRKRPNCCSVLKPFPVTEHPSLSRVSSALNLKHPRTSTKGLAAIFATWRLRARRTHNATSQLFTSERRATGVNVGWNSATAKSSPITCGLIRMKRVENIQRERTSATGLVPTVRTASTIGRRWIVTFGSTTEWPLSLPRAVIRLRWSGCQRWKACGLSPI